MKPAFLLDTGPLSVLCGFPIKGTPYIHSILQYADIVIPDAIVDEIQGAGKMARVLLPLLKNNDISSLAVPVSPLILDTSYGRDLGPGERAVIKCGLSTAMQIVLDDQDAFMVACRFKLNPIIFQDFIVNLVQEQTMPKVLAGEIVRMTARQFPSAYLTHTLDILS
jgi:hypothetical protein